VLCACYRRTYSWLVGWGEGPREQGQGGRNAELMTMDSNAENWVHSLCRLLGCLSDLTAELSSLATGLPRPRAFFPRTPHTSRDMRGVWFEWTKIY
jgi:hypothetical protein